MILETLRFYLDILGGFQFDFVDWYQSCFCLKQIYFIQISHDFMFVMELQIYLLLYALTNLGCFHPRGKHDCTVVVDFGSEDESETLDQCPEYVAALAAV